MFIPYPRPFRTMRGEKVYSQGEADVADFLYQNKIQYEYEKEIFLGGHKRVPDFYLPEHDIYIEYLGMISKPKCSYEYQLKEAEYQKYNKDVIYLYPQHRNFLGMILARRIKYKNYTHAPSEYVRLSNNHPQVQPRKRI